MGGQRSAVRTAGEGRDGGSREQGISPVSWSTGRLRRCRAVPSAAGWRERVSPPVRANLPRPEPAEGRRGRGGGGSGLRLPSLPSVSAGPREPNNNNPVNAQPGPRACQTASREVSVTKAVQLPNRPPDSESPTADLSEGSPEVGTSHSDFAVSRGPSPAAVPP